jgi:hypothetical protein
MNIIKLQDMLRGVPDNALIGYVQNPQGEVPSYLALSELQRRKDTRAKFQQEQAPETSVAEDLAAPPPPMQQGIASVAPQQMAMAPQPEMPMEQMAQGGLAELDVGNMYDEENYASGGIVAFARGGTPDDLGVIMPEVPTFDDLKMDQSTAFEQYGVDPEFYAKQARRLQEERDELKSDKSQAGFMALTRAGLGMAAGTSPFALKNISEGAIQGITQYGADMKDIKAQDRLLKQADMKLAEAQNAQNRGDAQGALKIMDERKNLLLNAQLKEADIRKDISVADAKARAAAAGNKSGLNIKIAREANEAFKTAFPAGAEATVFQSNPGFYQFVKNIYLKNMQDYADERIMPPIPSETALLDMFNNSKKGKLAVPVKPASKLSGKDSPLAATRPKNIQSILDKYSNKGSRSTNTADELLLTDPKYDNMGYQDDDYLQQ